MSIRHTCLPLLLLAALAVTSALLAQAAAKMAHCAMCGMNYPAESKTRFHIVMKDGKEMECCCAHCGLLLRCHQKTAARKIICYDYASGKEVNAVTALFVKDSNVCPCCAPSILPFATRAGAEHFRKAQGGTILSYQQALTEIGGKKK